MTSEVDVDCLARVDGLATVADVYDDESEPQDVAGIKPVWCVIAAVSITVVPVEARLQIRIGAASPAIPLIVLIPIFVPLIWLVIRWKSVMGRLWHIP